MLKRPIIIGANGSMGTRYQAVMRHLGVDYLPIDVVDAFPSPDSYDCAIVCTPTHTHIQSIAQLPKVGVPILMEKPFWKDLATVETLCDLLDERQTPIRMVNQYWHLAMDGEAGVTSYDYFRSGKDGLAWDVISLLALANGRVKFDQKSPFWSATINGLPVTHYDVEVAYSQMIEAFLGHPPVGPETPYIRMAHRRVAQYIEGKRDFDRDPGTLRIYQAAR